MQKQTETGKLVVKDGWVICPICGNKRWFRIGPETEARGLPVYCRDCKQEIILDITRGRSVERRSQ